MARPRKPVWQHRVQRRLRAWGEWRRLHGPANHEDPYKKQRDMLSVDGVFTDLSHYDAICDQADQQAADICVEYMRQGQPEKVIDFLTQRGVSSFRKLLEMKYIEGLTNQAVCRAMNLDRNGLAALKSVAEEEVYRRLCEVEKDI